MENFLEILTRSISSIPLTSSISFNLPFSITYRNEKYNMIKRTNKKAYFLSISNDIQITRYFLHTIPSLKKFSSFMTEIIKNNSFLLFKYIIFYTKYRWSNDYTFLLFDYDRYLMVLLMLKYSLRGFLRIPFRISSEQYKHIYSKRMILLLLKNKKYNENELKEQLFLLYPSIYHKMYGEYKNLDSKYSSFYDFLISLSDKINVSEIIIRMRKNYPILFDNEVMLHLAKKSLINQNNFFLFKLIRELAPNLDFSIRDHYDRLKILNEGDYSTIEYLLKNNLVKFTEEEIIQYANLEIIQLIEKYIEKYTKIDYKKMWIPLIDQIIEIIYENGEGKEYYETIDYVAEKFSPEKVKFNNIIIFLLGEIENQPINKRKGSNIVVYLANKYSFLLNEENRDRISQFILKGREEKEKKIKKIEKMTLQELKELVRQQKIPFLTSERRKEDYVLAVKEYMREF